MSDLLSVAPGPDECFGRGRQAEERFWKLGRTLDVDVQESARREAIACYSRAAEHGHASAQRALGWMYQCEHYDLDSIDEVDEGTWGRGAERAEPWFRRAAEQGHALGQVHLGLICKRKGDKRTAAMWFRRAAEQGLALGQLRLGEMLGGLEKQLWLNRAAEQGLGGAMVALGRMFDVHFDDFPVEYDKCLDCYPTESFDHEDEEDADVCECPSWSCQTEYDFHSMYSGVFDHQSVDCVDRWNAYVARKVTACMWYICARDHARDFELLGEWMSWYEIVDYLKWEADSHEAQHDAVSEMLWFNEETESSRVWCPGEPAFEWASARHAEARTLASDWAAARVNA